jgi:hypothetical protein
MKKKREWGGPGPSPPLENAKNANGEGVEPSPLLENKRNDNEKV